MDSVGKSTVIAGLIGAALGGVSYLLLASHKAIIQEFSQALTSQALPPEMAAFLPQAVLLTTALVMGLLGFAVAFLIVGTFLVSRSKA